MAKKMTKKEREAEAAYAEDIYKRRDEVSRQARGMLKERMAQKAAGLPITAGVRPPEVEAGFAAAMGTQQLTIRLGVADVELAKRQAAASGLKYQTYIKMVLHQALADRSTPARA